MFDTLIKIEYEKNIMLLIFAVKSFFTIFLYIYSMKI